MISADFLSQPKLGLTLQKGKMYTYLTQAQIALVFRDSEEQKNINTERCPAYVGKESRL